MAEIIIDNVYSKLNGFSKDIELKIWEKLSFEVKEFGCEYIQIRHLYNRKTKKTYTGLLNYVYEILEENNIGYKITDTRVVPEQNANFALQEYLTLPDGSQVALKARDYQQKIIDDASNREIIRAATGSGKTFMMAGLIDKFKIKPVSIFADKLTLCTQLKEEIGKFLGEEVGIVGGGMNEKRDITVYSAQSTTEEDIKDSNMILFDECHHIGSNTFVEISKWAKNAYYRIGVSATPWREDGADLLLEAALDRRKEENDISASKLIEWGYLVPCTIYFIPYKRVFQGKSYNKVYKEAIANNMERNQIIVGVAVKMREVKHAPILILIQQVEHGETILKMLSKKIEIVKKAVQVTDDKTGKDKLVRIANIEFLSGKDDAVRRKAVIQGVRDGFVEILIGSTIADEGLDIPNLEILILAGGGRSSTRAFQRVGRVLRLYKNPETGESKKRAIVFDFQDYTPMLRRHARTREKLYRTEEAWEIKKFNLNLLKE
jgi:superfamily II DNA or RNA helicase